MEQYYYRSPSKGFGFVEFETDEDEKPEVKEARPSEETSERLKRHLGTEAIDKTNKEQGESND
jgi:hypothetical protein